MKSTIVADYTLQDASPIRFVNYVIDELYTKHHSLKLALRVPPLMSVYNPTSHHCTVALDDQLVPNLYRDEVDGSHLARFLAATIAALPTA